MQLEYISYVLHLEAMMLPIQVLQGPGELEIKLTNILGHTSVYKL